MKISEFSEEVRDYINGVTLPAVVGFGSMVVGISALAPLGYPTIMGVVGVFNLSATAVIVCVRHGVREHKQRLLEEGEYYEEYDEQYLLEEGEDNYGTLQPMPVSKHTSALPATAQSLVLNNRKQWAHAQVELSDDYNPDLDDFIKKSIVCIGMRGSGKSEFAALLLEQIWKIPVIPGVCFDYKNDYGSLTTILDNVRIGGSPRWEDKDMYRNTAKDIYWDITVENAEEVGYTIRESCVQLVVQIGSWDTPDEQAQIMIGIIAGMMAWAKDNRGNTAPAIVHLDEAQQYLPQNLADSHISKTYQNALMRAFKKLNEVGRSLGLQPLIFTQRSARINKDVIAGAEVHILMRQTSPEDLKAVDIILGEKTDHGSMAGLRNGEAIIREGVDSFTTRFDRRQSKHVNITPGLDNAMTRYTRKVTAPTNFTVHPQQQDVYVDDEGEEYDEEIEQYVEPRTARRPLIEQRASHVNHRQEQPNRATHAPVSQRPAQPAMSVRPVAQVSRKATIADAIQVWNAANNPTMGRPALMDALKKKGLICSDYLANELLKEIQQQVLHGR